MQGKKVFIVIAHPESKSFCYACKDAVIETLKAGGYEVKVSDLYEMKFNPIVSLEDF